MKVSKVLLAVFGIWLMAPFSLPALAQDSAFLACGQYSDRGQRIACLEDALDAALGEAPQASVQTQTPATAQQKAPALTVAAPASSAAETTPSSESVEQLAEAQSQTSLLERIRSFGNKDVTSLSQDASGQDQLHDTITTLEKRNELWTVTLASGQVWRQSVARFLNLREGDEITIYQAGIGNGYRMATPRLSGFIRVERVK